MNGRSAPRIALALLLAAALGCATGPLPELSEEASEAVEEERRTQLEAATLRWLADEVLLLEIGSRVLRAGAPLCGSRVRPAIDVVALSRDDVAERFGRDGGWAPFRRFLGQAFGIGEHPRVLHVLPGSPAAAAGLEPGVEIVAVGGRPVDSMRAVANASLARRGAPTVRLTLRSDGSQREVEMESQPGCWFRTAVVISDVVNAWANGRRITVTRGLLRDAESRDEIAIVFGHELAHNVLDHVGVRSFKRDEYEADYLGLYFAARAGYDVSQAPGLWRRWGIERPSSISGRTSFAHGSSAERAVRLRDAAAEIEAKRRREEPLVPDGL